MIYLGFASLQGALIHWLRSEGSKDSVIAGVSFSALVFFPSSLSLPLAPFSRAVAWGGALFLIVVFSIRPASIPKWLWSLRFGLRYGAVTMGLILLWNLLNLFSGSGVALGIVAGVAGGSAWLRSREIET